MKFSNGTKFIVSFNNFRCFLVSMLGIRATIKFSSWDLVKYDVYDEY